MLYPGYPKILLFISLIERIGYTMKLKNNSGIRESNPAKELLDETLIDRAICECIQEDDFEGVNEVIGIYLEALKKTNDSEL